MKGNIMNNKKIENIFVVIIVCMIFIVNIIFSCKNFNKKYQENYDNKELKLLNQQSLKDNEYILSDTLQININNYNVLIPAQKIVKNSDSKILGFQYSLDGLNYTSTISLTEDHVFKFVKNISDLLTIYIKVVDDKYDEVLISQYCTKDYKYEPYVDIEVSTKDYTNGSVFATIKGNIVISDNYQLRYKINDGEFVEYKSTLEIKENNTKILAVIYNVKEEKVEKEVEYVVSNIDNKIPSKAKNIDVYIKDKKIYMKALDAADDESGILGYKYKINDVCFSDIIDKEYYYEYELISEKELKIEIITVDRVLNESESYEIVYNVK